MYEVDGVIHYCVANMPGAVPSTSTQALSNVTLPYIVAMANDGPAGAMRRDPALARGLNTFGGHITHDALGEALGISAVPFEQVA